MFEGRSLRRLTGVLFCTLAPVCAQSDLSLAIQPLLKTNCQPCHSQKTRTSGLALDSREAILAGGNRGPAVNPGAPGESLLLKAVEQRGELKMPPTGRLKDEQIVLLRQWIEQNLPWPAENVEKKDPRRDHWAFQPPTRRSIPSVANARWVRNEIDNFILARL